MYVVAGCSTVTRGTSADAAGTRASRNGMPIGSWWQQAAGVEHQVRDAGRLGGAGRVLAHLQGALVVHERQLEHDRIGAVVHRAKRRTIE